MAILDDLPGHWHEITAFYLVVGHLKAVHAANQVK